MANVLSTLFGDIANAIREKTGDTATIAPANFPTEIGKIEVGSGSSGEMGASWKRYSGFVTKHTAGTYTLEHNIGAVPDIFVIAGNAPTMYGSIVAAVGFSSAMNALIVDEFKGIAMVNMNTNIGTLSFDHGIETTNENAARYGLPRNMTATTVTIGGGTFAASAFPNSCGTLDPNVQYSWFAVCGIFGDVPSEE